MRNKLKPLIAVLYLLLLTTAFQCGEDIEVKPTYTFKELVDLYPEQKSYRIGDTIWLEYQNPSKIMVDQLTNKPIIVDTVSIGFPLSYNSRHNAPVSPAGGFCDFVTSKGALIAGFTSHFNTMATLGLGCDASRSYSFKVGIVPKIKGVYSLDLPGPLQVKACLHQQKGFSLSSIDFRFAVADGNKAVYLEIPAAQRGESVKGHTEGLIDNKQVFIIEVK
ncbi:hypothetical protein [Hymenobacter terrestris]|uniref:Gliding motility-associated protein GldM C-terminal domain-containing protein n=1 Tax=Hymenobacter terrestris TaxID=2748310 RepID=A0ABX2Q3U4_9BACT|nr:hypothetical protein [Hymenobacter terrestris]NVO84691.1 hypothetical protein [Hymenobacter terrestris]